MKTRFLIIFTIIGISLIIPQAWAPGNEPSFYGFSHFKNLPVLHPEETKSFLIKLENADKFTLYDVTPKIEVWPQESQPFVTIKADSIPMLESGKIGTINATINADMRLSINDLQINAYFTAKNKDGIIRIGGWSEHMNNIIKVERSLSPLKQFKSGIEPKDVVCKSGLELVMKKSNGQPICVKGTSVKSLTLRGYIPEYNGVLVGPIPTDDENKITYDTIIVDGKTYYFTIINETIPWTLEGKKINFHDVIFTLFPRPMIDNLGGFCGSGTFGASILFSDISRELLNIRTPETKCLDDLAKTDLTKISNHTNPQAGLSFSDNKIKLLVSTDSNIVVPRGDLFSQSLRIEGLNDTYSVGQKIEFTVKFNGTGYDCGYPHLRIENNKQDIIWESGGVVSSCDPDMKKDHIKKEWKIGDNTHFGTPIIDKEGFYTLFVTFGGDITQKNFVVR